MFGFAKKQSQTSPAKFDVDTETMLMECPAPILMCELNNFEIIYANKISVDTLRTIEDALPIKVDQLMGQTIDIFHKNPQRIRNILKDPSNLPYEAKIQVGEEHMDLKVFPIYNKKGEYTGPMLSWQLITEQVRMADNFESNVKSVAQFVKDSSSEMQETASSMSATTEELSTSISEISQQISKAAETSNGAVDKVNQSVEVMTKMEEAGERISNISKMINDIAEQTNLLALNATIEAARAGEAGKGFAVVASEVKALASQTAEATAEITEQIQQVQGITAEAVSSIKDVSDAINQMNQISNIISSAVEEQNTATQQSSASASGVLKSAQNLGGQSNQLIEEVENFLVEVRK